MTKQTYELLSIEYGIAGWDAANDTNHSRARALLLDAPFPVFEGSEPTASEHDRGLMAKNDGTAGWVLRLSDGSAWQTIPKQAAAVANLGTTASGTYTASELQAVIDKLDALLSALRAAGGIAP